MSVAIMAKQHPLSPPMSDGNDFDQSLQQRPHHHTVTANQPPQYSFDDLSYPPSISNTSTSTPEPGDFSVDPYARMPYPDQYGQWRYAIHSQVDVHGNPYFWQGQPPVHYGTPQSQYPHPPQPYYRGSPLTPSGSDQSNRGTLQRDMRRTETPRSTPIPGGRRQAHSRRSASPKPRKRPKKKSEKTRTTKLEAPISVLTKDMKHIPVKDMSEWVNRPAETRHKEVEDRKGYIARPMNSFMLYRSAYTERTKAWCTQNNHQIVSSVSGESWPMESEELREQYNEYARIERDNHQKAHPGYKFSPCKPQAGARKRKGTPQVLEDDEEGSALGDPDQEYQPPGRRKIRPKKQRNPRVESEYYPSTYPAGSSPYHEEGIGYYQPQAIHNPSSFHAINPGMAPPPALTNENMEGQYYQQYTQPRPGMGLIEDIMVRKEDRPGVQYVRESLNPSSDLSQGYDSAIAAMLQQELDASSYHNVDPLLQTQDPGVKDDSNDYAADPQLQEAEDQQRLFNTGSQTEELFGSTNHQPIAGDLEPEGNFNGNEGISDLDAWYNRRNSQ